MPLEVTAGPGPSVAILLVLHESEKNPAASVERYGFH